MKQKISSEIKSYESLLVHAAKVSNVNVLDYILNNKKFDTNKSNIIKAFVQIYSNSSIERFHQFQKAINKYQIKNKNIILNLIESRKLDIINSITKLYKYDHDRFY